jgi:hypothetical protein
LLLCFTSLNRPTIIIAGGSEVSSAFLRKIMKGRRERERVGEVPPRQAYYNV